MSGRPKSGRNIINTGALDDFLAEIAEDCRFDVTAVWLLKTARRWALGTYEQVWHVAREPITDRLVLVDPDEEDRVIGAYEDDVPDWAFRAIAAGEPLLYLRINQTLTKRIRRVVVWVETTSHPRKGPNIERMSFSDAEGQARLWWAERHRRPVWPPGVEPVFSLMGETVVKLTTQEALTEEGDAMSHCAGDYDWEVREGICEIYSVRDATGEPQATLEVDPDEGYVVQVKGQANGPVHPAHRTTLKAFIGNRGWKVVADKHNFDPRPARDMKPADLARFLESDAGAASLEAIRMVYPEAMDRPEMDSLIETLGLYSDAFNRRLQKRIFTLLSPVSSPVTFRPAEQYWIYGEQWPVVRVCLPLVLFQLQDRYFFDDAGIGEEVAALRSRVKLILPLLLFREPDRVFDLGPAGLPDRTPPDITHGAVAWLARGEFEVDGLRDARHIRVRQRLNAAKRRVAGKWARRSDPHQALRELLAGETGRYVI